MKKSWNDKRIGITALMLLLMLPVLWLIWGFGLPAQYDETFLGALKYKCQMLERRSGKRIIFLGGSSVAFGVDCDLVETALPDYQAVNFGMYAALGTEVMLDLARDRICEGDLVVVIPEQQLQTLSDYRNPEMTWQCFDGAFRLLPDLPPSEIWNMVSAFPHFASEKMRNTLSGEMPEGDGIYARASFDEKGDIVSALCSANEMNELYDRNMPIVFDDSLPTESFVAALNTFTSEAERRGAEVCYAFCPMNRRAVESPEDAADFCRRIQELLDCTVIGDPADSIMDCEWFYDTNFHLNSGGKAVYTGQLIRSLKAYLGITTPTELAMPEKPAPKTASAGAEPEADADCFCWQLQSDGTALLTGLTAEGGKRTELRVPAHVDGHPVTQLPAEVFCGNTVIRQVTLPSGITEVENGAFSGCSALKRIVLLHDGADVIRVGDGLLEGTNGEIYANKDYASKLKTNYFWANYADVIHTNDEY